MSAAQIHPTAIVGSRAEIGEGAIISPYVVIDDGAVIGPGVEIRPFAHITGHATIGARCFIGEHAAIGGDPQDHDFGGEPTRVEIGEDTIIREYVSIHRATGEGKTTVIGPECFIMESCHIAHNVRVGRGVTITNKTGFSGHSEVGDFAVVSGLTGVHQFVHIGAYAMVGGMSKVVKDIPPYSLADGNPSRIHGLNVVGLRRRGFSQDDRTKIKRIYRMIYDKTISSSEALALFEKEYAGDPHGEVIASFIKSSRRGLADWGDRR